MPRKLRVEYPGAIYHVMSRANGTGNIFETDVDRQDFIKTLAETCEKTGFHVHAYCLMRHHFHLVVETPNGNLVTGMRGRSGTIRGIEAKAERILRDELKRLRWSEGQLPKRIKSDPAKLAMAARLRRETTLPLPWIAARLHWGTWRSLSAKLHRWRKENEYR